MKKIYKPEYLDLRQKAEERLKMELIKTKEQATLASEKYIELYDSAPTGYFKLSPTGEIMELNPVGTLKKNITFNLY